MVRRLFVAAIALGPAVLLALPASAKGISYAHFGGPGLPPGGVTIHGDNEALPQTGLVELKGVPPSAVGLSLRDLGPAYRAKYRMDYWPRVALRQLIYPYAEGGPWTFTPRRQHIGQDYESFRGGWYHATAELLSFLIAHGFPKNAPQSPADRVIGANRAVPTKPAFQATSGPSENGWTQPLVVIIVVLLLGAVVAARRLRRVR